MVTRRSAVQNRRTGCIRGQKMTKSRRNGSTKPDSESVTRIRALANRRADEIVKKFGPASAVVYYRKALAL